MSRKIVYLLCILLCLGACNDDRFSGSNAVVSPPSGEAVPVKLVLDVAPLSSPLSATTRAGGNGTGLQASFSGMEVELSGQPVAITRQFPEVDENKIYSAAIFQFEGTAATSACSQVRFIEAGIDGTLDLSGFSFKSTTSPISRIVVVANLDANYFNITDWNSGGKTYKDLMDAHIKKNNSAAYPLYISSQPSGNRALMFGFTDTKIETGKLVTVVLQRIFTKCSFKIDIADALKTKYPVWRAELLNLPGRCYFVPAGRGQTFPSAALLGNDGYYGSATITAANGVFDSDLLDIYLPVNIQPDVPTATELTRTLVAPSGGTYLQIMGLKLTPNGSVQDQAIYQIYLGNNFTTNYTISPNTYYNYTIRVKDDNPEDGTLVRFIPGYWGGELKAYDASGAVVAFNDAKAVKWRYEKEIEFYPYDIIENGSTQIPWGQKGYLGFSTSLTDGRKNTWNLQGMNGNQDYKSSFVCFKLNTSVTSEQSLMWYQPSISQLVGTYLVCANLFSTLSDGYLSSTSYDYGNAYYISRYGRVAYVDKEHPFWVRAARDFN